MAICTTLGNSARQEMGTTSCRVRARVLRSKEGVRGAPHPQAAPVGAPTPRSPQQQVEVLLLIVLEGEYEVS